MLKNIFSLNQRLLFLMHDPIGVKLLTRLRLQLSCLNELKFCHNFKDCMSLMCDCGAETEITSHFFLCCQFFANKRQKLHDDFYWIDASIKNLNEDSLTDVILCGSDRFNDGKNKYFSIQSVIFKLPNVFKDLLLTSANFVELLLLCFSFICLLKLNHQWNLLYS